MIVIVLLNVVIAIVREAWSTAAKQSTKLFWKYRVGKISELNYTEKINLFQLSNTRLMRYIDNIENVSYTNDISWAKAPYHNVTKKYQYDKPSEFFSPDIATQIIKSKSLQNDMYWAKMDNPNYSRIKLILKWVGTCILYTLLIIMGFLTCGIFFPKKFRQGVLLVGSNKTVDNPQDSNVIENPHKDFLPVDTQTVDTHEDTHMIEKPHKD